MPILTTPERELEYLDLFQNHPVDGIVLVATMITDEHRAAITSCRVPIVLIGQNVEGAACVYHDDYEAAFELGQALAGRVDGKIAYIGVTEEDRAAGYDRRRGFEAGLGAAGVVLDPELIRRGSFTLDSGYRASRELLGEVPDVSFIACATDTMAAGALRAIDEVRGMGEGIHRVSGFGDNAFLRALTGGIPTVHYGYLTSGVEATSMLLDTLDGVEGERGLKTLKLGHQLMNV
ncbi:MAG: trehalose repressor [Collinsella sp.]